MTTQDILIDIVKTGVFTLVSSKIVKAMGEKDIAEIISGSGWIVCGVNVVLLIKPLVKWIKDACGTIGDGVKGFNDTVNGISEFIKRGHEATQHFMK